MDDVGLKLGSYSADTLLESSNVLLSVVSAHSDHSFVVEKALRMLRCTMQLLSAVETLSLIDCGAIRTLLDAVVNHASDKSIIHECFLLLLVLLHNNRNSLIMTGEMIARSAHRKVAKACELLINNSEVCGTGMEVLLSLLEIGSSASDEQSTNSTVSRGDNSVLDDLLQADIVPTLLRMAHNYTHSENQPVLGLLLELLCELTADLHAREHFVRLRGLHVMREVLASVETENVLVESALDCLVNVACSPHSQHQWPPEMALELLHLGDRLHERGAPSDCVEKVIGILTRLAVTDATSVQLSKDGAHVILQLVSLVDNDRYLEIALFGLLSQLSFVTKNIPVLVASDAIAITLERLCINLHDDSLLQCNLSLLYTMLLSSDCSSASVDPKMTLMMQLILEESSRSSRVRQLAQALLDDLTRQRQLPDPVVPIEPVSPKVGVAPVVPIESREPEQVQQTPEQSENMRVTMYQQRLRQGAVFRVRRDPKLKKREKIYICLADSSEYLIMRTLLTEPPIVERVFVSQLEVLPNTDAEPSRRQSSLPLGLSVPSLVRSTSRTQCIFHLLIKKELVSLEATNPAERQEWERMLQWLVQSSSTRTATQLIPRLKPPPYQ
ncbi:hypothetical protein PINS_up001761 [Pythium insidiosum]|nr:hypothetical protein PINS_up001761 [Pythium insidiosum]